MSSSSKETPPRKSRVERELHDSLRQHSLIERRIRARRHKLADLVTLLTTPSTEESGISSQERNALLRACRIALMEAELPERTSLISRRIHRRGSFDLSRYDSPVKLVSQALAQLLWQGEALAIPGAHGKLWCRVINEELLAAPHRIGSDRSNLIIPRHVIGAKKQSSVTAR